jgi:hypothetical protein
LPSFLTYRAAYSLDGVDTGSSAAVFAYAEQQAQRSMERLRGAALRRRGKRGAWRFTEFRAAVLPSDIELAPRLILDNRAANAYQREWPFRLTSLAEIVAAISPGAYGAVRDAKSGYNHIRLAQASAAYARTHLPVESEGRVRMQEFEYRRQFFGDSSAVAMFSALSGFVTWLCRRDQRWPAGAAVFAFIDDLTIIHATKAGCKCAESILDEVCAKLGLALEPKKEQRASQQFTVLGVNIDTVEGTLALPPAKAARRMHELLVALQCAEERIPVPKRFLRELVSKLEHWTTLFPTGRAFLTRLWGTMTYGNWREPTAAGRQAEAAAREGGARAAGFSAFMDVDVPLHGLPQAVAELRWWAQLLRAEGLKPQRLLHPIGAPLWRFAAHTSSDAAGDIGWAIVSGPVALWGLWEAGERAGSSSRKELVPVRRFLQRFGLVVAGTVLVTLTDNAGNGAALNRLRARGDGYDELQSVARACMTAAVTEVTRFAPREANDFCDRASRCETLDAITSLCRHPVSNAPAMVAAGGGLAWREGEDAVEFGRRARKQ